MIEVSIVDAYDDYRDAMNKAKDFDSGVVLLSIHSQKRTLYAPVSKNNWKSVLELFDKDVKRPSFIHS